MSIATKTTDFIGDMAISTPTLGGKIFGVLFKVLSLAIYLYDKEYDKDSCDMHTYSVRLEKRQEEAWDDVFREINLQWVDEKVKKELKRTVRLYHKDANIGNLSKKNLDRRLLDG